jgi:hypothetical protein
MAKSSAIEKSVVKYWWVTLIWSNMTKQLYLSIQRKKKME